MLELNEEAKPKIEPTRERIKEIAHELMNPKNAVSRRLKSYKLMIRVIKEISVVINREKSRLLLLWLKVT